MVSRSAWRRIVPLTLAMWCVLAAFPALPPPTRLGLDPSWVLGINLAHVQGLVMGRELVWPYGPLAYLSIPNPAGQHMWAAFLYKMLVYAIWGGAVLRLCVWLLPFRRGLWVAMVWGVVAAMDPFFSGDHLEAAVLTLALTFLLDQSRWKSIELLLLSLAAATALLVRYNLGIEAIAVVLILSLGKDVTQRAIPALAALPIALLALFAAATGHITALWPYLRNGWELATGYSEAMSVPGPAAVWLTYLGAFACLFGLALRISPRDSRFWAAFAVAAVFSFFLFKNSVVRQDGSHSAPFFLKLCLISLFFTILKSTRRVAVPLAALQVASLAAGYVPVARVWPETPVQTLNRLTLRDTAKLAWDYAHWPRTWRRMETETSLNLRAGWLPAPFLDAVGNGTVDAAPWNIAVLRANGWRWQPRPVFQSYAAYTPALDSLNAGHIRSPGAADFVLVNWEAIDGRHPFLEDPLSWKARLDYYVSDYMDGGNLLMRRRASPLTHTVEPITAGTLHWNQEAAAPIAREWVILYAEIHPTLSGRLRKLFFRLDPVWLRVTFQSGYTQKWRVIRPNLQSGVLMNMLPKDLGDLALIGRGCVLPDPVVSVRFEADRPQDYDRDIPIRWERWRGVDAPQPVVLDGKNPCPAPTPQRGEFPDWGGAGQVTVSAGSGTVWGAAANAPWIGVNSGASGAGNRTVSYTVGANPSHDPRTSPIYLEHIPYLVRQLGVPKDGAGAQLGLFRMDREYPRGAPSGGLPAFADILDSFGLPGDQPVMGDWTGDGRIRVGVFRKGEWYLDLNGNRRWDGIEGGDGLLRFGLPGDIPVTGDWNGNGVTKIGVFRCPRNGVCTWVLDLNGNGQFDSHDIFLYYGLKGDIPVVWAWSGSKADKIGIFRNGDWYVDSDGDGRFETSDQHFVFGSAGDVPVVSRTGGKIGVYRSGKWILDSNGNRQIDPADREFVFGLPKDKPLIADW